MAQKPAEIAHPAAGAIVIGPGNIDVRSDKHGRKRQEHQ